MKLNNTVPPSSSPSLILVSFPNTKMSVFTRTLPTEKAPSHRLRLFKELSRGQRLGASRHFVPLNRVPVSLKKMSLIKKKSGKRIVLVYLVAIIVHQNGSTLKAFLSVWCIFQSASHVYYLSKYGFYA